MANKKIQITPEVDARQAVDGFAKVGKAADEMADKVKGAGKESQKGMEKLGDGGDEAARKVDRTTKSIISSIERTTAVMKAGGRGSAEYFEALAQQRGANVDALKPYLDGLRQAKAAQDAATVGLNTMGMTAKQTTAALRQVPAQFTDIAVSLAGGQNPMTVLLQQGGQLKDVFGGAGAAAQALGGYVLGLVNPLTVAAAAAAALAYGFFTGAEEAKEFNKALVLSGNTAGLTVGQLTAMAERLDAIGTTQAKASEVLTEFARSGKVGAENLERFALAAINLEKVGGPAATETAKAFADLGKAPLDGALKLNEATGFLTKSVYEQIKALTDQGQTVEAAKVAQEAYAAAIEVRAPKISEQLGYIERAWRGIKDATSEAIDAAKGVGRIDNSVEGALNRARQQRDNAIAVGDAPATVRAEEEIRILERSAEFAKKVAESTARGAEMAKAKTEFDKQGEQYLSGQAKLERDIAQARQLGLKAGESEAVIQTRIAEIRDKANASANRKADTAATRELEAQRKLLAEMSGLSSDFYDDWNRLSILFKSGAFKTIEDFEGAQRKILADQPFAKEQAKAAKDAAEEAKKLSEEWLKGADAYAKWLEELNKGGDAAAKQVALLKDEAEAAAIVAAKNISLAQAIEEVAIARLQERRDKSPSDQERAALDREIAERRKLIAEIGKSDARKASEDALKALDKFLDPKRADDFGAALTKAFDGAGSSVARMVNLLEQADRQRAQNIDAQRNIRSLEDGEKKVAAQRALNIKSQRESLELYAGLTGASKGFFQEGTKGYKALEIAETAFRAYQLASDFQKGMSAATVGVASQAQGEPYTAFARMAAMAATMASLGYQVANFSGSGASGGGDGAKVATGSGTVLGNAESQSESITRSIDLLGDTAQLQLRTQSGMLDALRSIEARIGGITNQVLRSGTATGDVASAFGITTGKTSPKIVDNFFTGGGNGPSLLMGNLIRSLFNTKTNITGSGLSAGPQSVESILGSGFNLQNFADVNSKSKFFGITVSNKNSTEYQAADPALSRQFGLVFQDFANALSLAADPLGLALNDVKERINAFTIDIGKIDLKDLTGEEIAEKLGAILGAAADSLATAAIPGLLEFQRVGEGYFETTIRVASGIETAGAALDLLGITAVSFGDVARKQGDVAAEIVRQSIAGFESLDGSISSIGEIIKTLDGSADDLAQTYTALLDVRDVLLNVGESGDALTAIMLRSAGGLDALQGSLTGYFEDFFTSEERAAAQLARLSEDFARIGVQDIPKTREEFRRLVDGIDTSTASGQEFFAKIISLSRAFADAVPASEALGESVQGLAKQLDYVVTAQGRFDASAFNSELAKISTDDILADIRARSGDDRARAEANFAVGSGTFLGAYANSLAGSRLAAPGSNPVPNFNNGSAANDFDPMAEIRQREIDALKALTDSMRSLDDQLGGFLDSVTFGADSFLSPEERFMQSQAALASVIKQAGAGDQAAAEQVQARAQAFVEANRAYFGATQQGTDNLAAMVKELQSLREQVRSLIDTAESGNRITANGLGAVEAATSESAELTSQALARARLGTLKTVGFDS